MRWFLVEALFGGDDAVFMDWMSWCITTSVHTADEYCNGLDGVHEEILWTHTWKHLLYSFYRCDPLTIATWGGICGPIRSKAVGIEARKNTVGISCTAGMRESRPSTSCVLMRCSYVNKVAIRQSGGKYSLVKWSIGNRCALAPGRFQVDTWRLWKLRWDSQRHIVFTEQSAETMRAQNSVLQATCSAIQDDHRANKILGSRNFPPVSRVFCNFEFWRSQEPHKVVGRSCELSGEYYCREPGSADVRQQYQTADRDLECHNCLRNSFLSVYLQLHGQF